MGTPQRDRCLKHVSKHVNNIGRQQAMTSLLVRPVYKRAHAAAGQAGAALHIVAVLQAYQVDLLKDLDFAPETVAELRHTPDLALRATKQAAAAIGRSLAVMVATERPLWINLADIILAHTLTSGPRAGLMMFLVVSDFFICPTFLIGLAQELECECCSMSSWLFSSFLIMLHFRGSSC